MVGLMELRSRSAALVAVVGVAGLMLGALFGGNLFTLISGEYGGVGPGFMQKIGLKVDTVTTINTLHPENYMTGMERMLSPVVSFIWQLTGKMWIEPDGTYTIFWSRHAGVLYNGGADWIEDQISDSPDTTPAAYISLSSSAHAPTAADHNIWGEINTAGGLDRVGGTYASTGTGAWTVTHQFTADTTYTNVQLTGLNYSDTDASNNTILCADTFTPVTLATNDKLTITWTVGVS
jgi:hypothetical protein